MFKLFNFAIRFLDIPVFPSTRFILENCLIKGFKNADFGVRVGDSEWYFCSLIGGVPQRYY